MRTCIAVAVVSALLCAADVCAQTAVLPERFGTWEAEGPSTAVKSSDAAANWTQKAKGDLVLQEAGVSRIEQRLYRNGADELRVRTFTLRDPSSAFEFYTFLLSPGMHNMGVGEDSAISEYDGRFLVGNLVVQATLSPKSKPESLNGLLASLKAKADPTPLPPLKSYLPEKWRVFGSERYALGPEAFKAAMTLLNQGAYADLANEVGFQSGVEAMLARFHSDRNSGVLLLLEYPTPQLAENHLHHLEEALPPAAKQAGVTIERKASMLSLVLAADSREYAQALRDEVNYETEVTWNEPSQTATDPPLVVIMVKIFLFTGLFLAIATMAGIAFGAVRILIKRLLPGKVFDRPQDIEVLQLGLSGKKIDPTDLY
jgi:hypothetical protein